MPKRLTVDAVITVTVADDVKLKDAVRELEKTILRESSVIETIQVKV